MTELGTGFIPPSKEKVYYFDKNSFLTLGNGDKLYKEDSILPEAGKDDELKSEFLSILTSLVFFTDPSESNRVVVINKKQESYSSLLCELFPDYHFSFVGRKQFSVKEENGNWKEDMSEDNIRPIIFCDNIINYRHLIENKNPYLIMGEFDPRENLDFFDGIVLRPVYGEKPRLLVKGIATRCWNKKNFRRLVDYHLYVVKQNYLFRDPVTWKDELDFDKASHRYILSKYLEKVNLPNGDMNNVENMIEERLS